VLAGGISRPRLANRADDVSFHRQILNGHVDDGGGINFPLVPHGEVFPGTRPFVLVPSGFQMREGSAMSVIG